MLKQLPFLLLIIFSSCLAQEKVKGSRNVKTEQYDLNSFHSIEASGEFNIEILRGSKALVEIKADDNLHDLIQTDVVDGVLFIKPIKQFVREKSQDLKITFADTLKTIKIAGKVEFTALQDLELEDFELITRENCKVYITLKANEFRLMQYDDARAELNITAQNTDFQLNQSSDLRALVNSPVFNVDTYEKASAKIEGDVQDFTIRADQSSKFDGENLSCVRADLLAQGNPDVKINISDTLNLRTSGRSEIEIYNNPVVNLIQFDDEAVIRKKKFSKGLFK